MKDGWACFSKNGKYRYLLGRRIGHSRRRVLFIMLNPSKANAVEPDNTITRCTNFARDWGYGTMEVVNLFAFKSTDPAGLWEVKRPVGKRNNAFIHDAVSKADHVILAWSGEVAKDPKFKRRAACVLQMVCKITPPYHLGFTKTGEPRHPRVLPKSVTPKRWKKSQIAKYLRTHS